MKVSGVITEYNPFHNGHKYQLDKIREETHSDYIIVAMSGNFVQRGAPAFLDKYLRTEIALKCGADLVLEIPVIGATASAESFANAGVSILNSTGVVSYLCYGVEKKSDVIYKIASFLRNPSTKFNEKLATYTKSGDSFPIARAPCCRKWWSLPWGGKKAIYIKLNMEKHGNKLKAFSVNAFFLVIFYKKCQSAFTNDLLTVILSHVVVRD